MQAKKILPINWAKLVSESTGYTQDYIRKVYAGTRYNEFVLTEIHRVKREFQKKQKKLLLTEI